MDKKWATLSHRGKNKNTYDKSHSYDFNEIQSGGGPTDPSALRGHQSVQYQKPYNFGVKQVHNTQSALVRTCSKSEENLIFRPAKRGHTSVCMNKPYEFGNNLAELHNSTSNSSGSSSPDPLRHKSAQYCKPYIFGLKTSTDEAQNATQHSTQQPRAVTLRSTASSVAAIPPRPTKCTSRAFKRRSLTSSGNGTKSSSADFIDRLPSPPSVDSTSNSRSNSERVQLTKSHSMNLPRFTPKKSPRKHDDTEPQGVVLRKRVLSSSGINSANVLKVSRPALVRRYSSAEVVDKDWMIDQNPSSDTGDTIEGRGNGPRITFKKKDKATEFKDLSTERDPMDRTITPFAPRKKLATKAMLDHDFKLESSEVPVKPKLKSIHETMEVFTQNSEHYETLTKLTQKYTTLLKELTTVGIEISNVVGQIGDTTCHPAAPASALLHSVASISKIENRKAASMIEVMEKVLFDPKDLQDQQHKIITFQKSFKKNYKKYTHKIKILDRKTRKGQGKSLGQIKQEMNDLESAIEEFEEWKSQQLKIVSSIQGKRETDFAKAWCTIMKKKEDDLIALQEIIDRVSHKFIPFQSREEAIRKPKKKKRSRSLTKKRTHSNSKLKSPRQFQLISDDFIYTSEEDSEDSLPSSLSNSPTGHQFMNRARSLHDIHTYDLEDDKISNHPNNTLHKTNPNDHTSTVNNRDRQNSINTNTNTNTNDTSDSTVSNTTTSPSDYDSALIYSDDDKDPTVDLLHDIFYDPFASISSRNSTQLSVNFEGGAESSGNSPVQSSDYSTDSILDWCFTEEQELNNIKKQLQVRRQTVEIDFNKINSAFSMFKQQQQQ
eukprot:CAMPEP_0174258658 /NCGR_PEP_ID=MMETSP0439-20130205/7615_1 /TAXON_ID=0 /ORGANISM="Stereomyxa ramosa, Strain Chinc5" /LENGTH=828 /DNA_ID=CAMNT_0015342249 /DNA_START=185 /DNA_END=2671 /DNA_ORIENTATION=-